MIWRSRDLSTLRARPFVRAVKAIIVDDSKAMRLIIKRIVTELGFTTIEAGNGKEALDVLAGTGDVDLALVDWNMPVMNGYEFVCSVRQQAARSGMRILMVTTETDVSNVARALEAGASEYLMKPFTKDGIADKLAMIGLRAT